MLYQVACALQRTAWQPQVWVQRSCSIHTNSPVFCCWSNSMAWHQKDAVLQTAICWSGCQDSPAETDHELIPKISPWPSCWSDHHFCITLHSWHQRVISVHLCIWRSCGSSAWGHLKSHLSSFFEHPILKERKLIGHVSATCTLYQVLCCVAQGTCFWFSANWIRQHPPYSQTLFAPLLFQAVHVFLFF